MRWRAGITLGALAMGVVMGRSALAADAAKAQEGEQVYENYCANCHGEGLHNTSGGVTFDLRKLRPDEHDRFIDSVTNGKKQMPPWKGVLDRDKMEAVWAYIRATVDGK
ncbi:MAG TPA: cytochrome c [Alphaproteobacteria bacterium]|nr:cytochrome c [Alphaproteobacteria bacterium]